MKFLIMALLLGVSSIANAACLQCGANRTCYIVNGNGFENCSTTDGCSGNCYSGSSGGGSGSGGTGSGPIIIWPEFDEDGYGGFAADAPDVKKERGVEIISTCIQCKPEVKGLPMKKNTNLDLFVAGKQNWLLAAAMRRMEDLNAVGTSESRAFYFAVPHNIDEGKVFLQNGALEDNPDKAKYSGMAMYQSQQKEDEMQIIMQVWQVNQQKGLPTLGLFAKLDYQKEAGNWVLRKLELNKKMPIPPEGMFPALDQSPQIKQQFMAKFGK